MKGADAAIAKYPFIDGTRLAAAGGWFGGYMVDWIATHSDRFKCLISHAGSYDMVSMYGATEELWFMDWEFGGPPWSHPELYKKYSPSEYAAALSKYKTPTLVVGFAYWISAFPTPRILSFSPRYSAKACLQSC